MTWRAACLRSLYITMQVRVTKKRSGRIRDEIHMRLVVAGGDGRIGKRAKESVEDLPNTGTTGTGRQALEQNRWNEVRVEQQ